MVEGTLTDLTVIRTRHCNQPAVLGAFQSNIAYHNHLTSLLCLLQHLHCSLFSKVWITFPAEHICFCPITYLIALCANILDSVYAGACAYKWIKSLLMSSALISLLFQIALRAKRCCIFCMRTLQWQYW